MSAELSEVENSAVGAGTGVIETLILQPTMYAKNTIAQGLPLTLSHAYRGLAAAMFNEVGQLVIGFGVTGAIKANIEPADGSAASPLAECGAAAVGGALVGTFASPCELLMIQQQRFGGGIGSTVTQVVRGHGMLGAGVLRGLGCCVMRDSIYVGGMLGITPLAQGRMEAAGVSTPVAVLASSAVGGVFGGVVSHPFDVIKTCMQGDIERKTYGSNLQAARTLLAEGGVRRLFSGVGWRTVNITGTVYIASLCAQHLPPYVLAVTRGAEPAAGASERGRRM